VTRFTVVFLTGYFTEVGVDRRQELLRSIDRVRAQRLAPGDSVQQVVVVNGGTASELPADVLVVELPANVGIPAGRNVGWRAGGGDLVVFLDDDGWLPRDNTFERLDQLFDGDPRLGIVSMRIADPEIGETQRRHVPRLRAGDPMTGGEVTTFLGGASAMRRVVLEQTGGLPDDFFLTHEETDLAWQALDRGWRIRYDPDCVLNHPTTSPARHALFFRLNARNRVWLAKRNLPVPVGILYVWCWIALTVARVHDAASLRVWFAGLVEGLRTPAGPRRPISWRTVWRMTRLGRPPIV
jgi:GT2 family glycosyltransferase